MPREQHGSSVLHAFQYSQCIRNKIVAEGERGDRKSRFLLNAGGAKPDVPEPDYREIPEPHNRRLLLLVRNALILAQLMLRYISNKTHK